MFDPEDLIATGVRAGCYTGRRLEIRARDHVMKGYAAQRSCRDNLAKIPVYASHDVVVPKHAGRRGKRSKRRPFVVLRLGFSAALLQGKAQKRMRFHIEEELSGKRGAVGIREGVEYFSGTFDGEVTVLLENRSGQDECVSEGDIVGYLTTTTHEPFEVAVDEYSCPKFFEDRWEEDEKHYIRIHEVPREFLCVPTGLDGPKTWWITDERITELMLSDGTKETLRDEWRGCLETDIIRIPPCARGEKWTGRTLFPKKLDGSCGKAWPPRGLSAFAGEVKRVALSVLQGGCQCAEGCEREVWAVCDGLRADGSGERCGKRFCLGHSANLMLSCCMCEECGARAEPEESSGLAAAEGESTFVEPPSSTKPRRRRRKRDVKFEPSVMSARGFGGASRRRVNRNVKFTRLKTLNRMMVRAYLVGLHNCREMLNDQLLVDATEADCDDLMRAAYIPKKAPGVLREEIRGYVTRLCDKDEKTTPEAVNARRTEILKVIGFGSFSDKPLTIEEARANFPDATVSGVYCITSIKHVQKAQKFWQYKGRLVLLGNQIKRIRDYSDIFPSGDSIGIYGDVVSLEGFRSVLAHGVVHGYKVECADLSNAYLQADWPKNVPPHFIHMPEDVIEVLPEELSKKMWAKGGPRRALLQMHKCLYGHPLSGHVWIECCLSYLRSKGWREMPGNRALLRRGKCLIAVYVDDMCAAGPDDELEYFWQELCSPESDEKPEGAFGRFLVGKVEPCKEFLGMEVHYGMEGDFRTTTIDMSKYAAMIVESWKKLYEGKRLKQSWVPMTDGLREEPDELKPPSKDVQKMIGMLLWISRCGRPEIAFCLSRLGTRVSRWTTKCQEQMDRCVGYLWNSSGGKDAKENVVLRMKVHLLDKPEDLRSVVYTDADLSVPRSQSGMYYVLESVRGSLVPVHWTSKKQSIEADSTGSSELIAAHTGLRECLMVHDALKPDGEPLLLLTDNSVVVRVSRRGSSSALDYLAKRPLAIRLSLLRDMRDYGIVEVEHVETEKNRADIFTKQMDRLKFQNLRSLLGMVVSKVEKPKPAADVPVAAKTPVRRTLVKPMQAQRKVAARV